MLLQSTIDYQVDKILYIEKKKEKKIHTHQIKLTSDNEDLRAGQKTILSINE